MTDAQTTTDVVVIGGGVSGLAAAHRLAASGAQVQILEASPQFGGILRGEAMRCGDVEMMMDTGAEAVLNRRPEAVGLVRDLGLGDAIRHPDTTSPLIACRGELVPLPTGTAMGIPTARSDVSALLNVAEKSQHDELMRTEYPAETGDRDVHTLVSERCGEAVADRLVEPLLGGVYAGHAAELSAQAVLPALWAAVQQPGALADLLPPASPDDQTLAVPVFAGIEGGVHQLVGALTDAVTAAGGATAVNAPVSALRRAGDRWLVTTTDAEYSARDVVIAVPAPAAAEILRAVDPAIAVAADRVPTASVAVMTMILPSDQGPPEGHSGLLVPPIEGRFIKAATFSSSKWAWVKERVGDRHAVRLSVGRAGSDQVARLTDEALIRTAIADYAHLVDTPCTPEDVRVTRWPEALPQYLVGHHRVVTGLQERVAQWPGLHVIGAMINGVGIAACVGLAHATADHIIAETRTPAEATAP